MNDDLYGEPAVNKPLIGVAAARALAFMVLVFIAARDSSVSSAATA